jgi:hypothetical protein
MKRMIEPEWLDALPPDDPDAVRSRRDLRRVNAWMGHPAIMADVLRSRMDGGVPEQMVELGAGDGRFLLQVAQRLAAGIASRTPGDRRSGSPAPDQPQPERQSPEPHLTLLDRQKLVTRQTLDAYAALGWQAEVITADVFRWLHGGGRVDAIVTNLFLHHFYEVSLSGLLRAIADRARLFVALEPRRGALPWLGSRLLWAIGCNYVTQHDAALSVRAGFDADELSRLWPPSNGWNLTEQRAGAFSHLFIAQKVRSNS